MNSSNLGTPVKSVKAKIPKPNTLVRVMVGREEAKAIDMHEIQEMFTAMMVKLEKLDHIESDMKEIKHSLEYAHAEIVDLKKGNETNKTNQE